MDTQVSSARLLGKKENTAPDPDKSTPASRQPSSETSVQRPEYFSGHSLGASSFHDEQTYNEAADQDISLTRPSYFSGQTMESSDMEAEQAYEPPTRKDDDPFTRANIFSGQTMEAADLRKDQKSDDSSND